MISRNKKRISISVSKSTIELLEYNAESMGLTKSELIELYVNMIGKAGEQRESLFLRKFKVRL